MQGNRQYRVDSRSGRTDRLEGASGWKPVTFDRAPEKISFDEIEKNVRLTQGGWVNGESDTPGQICFDVRNNSEYVLQDLRFYVAEHPLPADWKIPGDSVVINRVSGGLLDVGDESKFCGPAPRVLAKDAEWNHSRPSGIGWKK